MESLVLEDFELNYWGISKKTSPMSFSDYQEINSCYKNLQVKIGQAKKSQAFDLDVEERYQASSYGERRLVKRRNF